MGAARAVLVEDVESVEIGEVGMSSRAILCVLFIGDPGGTQYTHFMAC